jgi:hypothetical protein
MMGAVKEVDGETKKMLKEILKALFHMAQLRVRDEITRKPKQIMESITQRIESAEKGEFH